MQPPGAVQEDCLYMQPGAVQGKQLMSPWVDRLESTAAVQGDMQPGDVEGKQLVSPRVDPDQGNHCFLLQAAEHRNLEVISTSNIS